MLKVILSLVLLLSVVLVKAQFEGYPPLDKPPTPLKEWVDLIDFTRVPNAPVKKTPESCGAIDTYCDWSCTNCTNKTTDYDRCPPGVNNEKIWGISYDDGPSEFTPAILDHLKAIGAKATFFVIGSRITENPAILARTVAEGHQIGVHTWSHNALTTQTNEEIIGEIKWTEEIIKNVTGVTPNFMRPPFGDIDDRVRGIITQLGYKAVIWDLDTNDWMTDDKPKDYDEQWIIGNFTQWTTDPALLTSSHISLEHDLYVLAAKYAPQALDLVKGAGFTIEQVAACVGEDPYREYHGFNNTATNVTSTVVPTATTATNAVTTDAAVNTPSPSQSGSTPQPYSSNSSSFSSLNIFAIAIVSIIFTFSSFLFLI